ncbi:MAG: biotin--[acetyl-CoA-carboxylase] ligase [Bacteroidetes bacterium CG02_land_8_20_14_3_00_31_25]|nr:biotin--[acetyl-CoA-carboxylase] ligase [Bacteroidota bacterium]PIV57706.1 MAG: biotin--[acetyl-CoA-carboxylase] ligase [Bacteroidetes bacterium CG02_land_8_20_14_3_00_31_25]PIX32543.1 MAG: biotin--[acetyl-CoA-carboxylase] ligase [Bacteroidetes bacterium CG_4_8_14_3_um_filter_31_14]PIY07095.1 MAG: biotin--[acetyl-CoA-carboxylase] ligase [Bacteroidetes bacterium CG_4_10_14_3_um_filter_31_20]
MKTIKIKEANSSNSVALEMLDKQNVDEGTIIVVENQTSGRGQNENKWYSEPSKNLTFSIIFKPTFLKPENQFYLSKVISLGVVDYVGLFCSNIAIKWPNDICIENKKVAGILIENTWLGQKINASVVGIGINLNQEKFPSDLPNAISLKIMTQIPFNLDESLKLLTNLIFTRYTLLKLNDFKLIDKDYDALLYRKTKESSFTKNGEMFKATILGVETNGHLRLKHSDGRIANYGMHEIRMI